MDAEAHKLMISAPGDKLAGLLSSFTDINLNELSQCLRVGPSLNTSRFRQSSVLWLSTKAGRKGDFMSHYTCYLALGI